MVPTWLLHWFDDEPPDGASVTRKSTNASASYLGTIDGIDIHVAPVAELASALLPDDLLAELAYGQGDDGRVLDIRRDSVPDRGELTIDLAIKLSWREDPIIWLHFPRAESAVLDER